MGSAGKKTRRRLRTHFRISNPVFVFAVIFSTFSYLLATTCTRWGPSVPAVRLALLGLRFRLWALVLYFTTVVYIVGPLRSNTCLCRPNLTLEDKRARPPLPHVATLAMGSPLYTLLLFLAASSAASAFDMGPSFGKDYGGQVSGRRSPRTSAATASMCPRGYRLLL